MTIIELLSVENQNKRTEKNNINDKSWNHLQSECQHQIQHKKQKNRSKQHQDRQQELQRQTKTTTTSITSQKLLSTFNSFDWRN